MEKHTESLGDGVKYILDTFSFMTVLGTLVDMLPSIAALFTIVWTVIRIWETDTMRSIVKRKRTNAKPKQEAA